MKFNCHFANGRTDERKAIVVSLTAEECAAVDRVRSHSGDGNADLHAMCYAMRHAHFETPRGFEQLGPPELIRMS